MGISVSQGIVAAPVMLASAVAITGGTINNVVIGGTTPAAGTFTTLSSVGAVTVATAQTVKAKIDGDGSFAYFYASATNGGAVLSSVGTGNVDIRSDANSVVMGRFVRVASANRLITFTPSNGGNPAISVSGGELSVGTNAWTFGVVNTVSPTSPNRTLTVTIGGTTYYIAAKTTND